MCESISMQENIKAAAKTIGLGIDAGGTFTDSAIVDLDKGEVLSKFKTPTTKNDLTNSIKLCIDALDKELLPKCSLVSLSTTFATNAIVERKGARAGIILLGYDEYDNARVQADNRIIVAGKHDVRGNVIEPLDEDGLRRAIHSLIDDCNVEAIAISGMCSVMNPAHELEAKAIAMSECDLPIVCGHELSMELNAIKRATTAYLNAKLLPVVINLIHAVEDELKSREIKAPLVVVRSDGSLMSAVEALSNPIHTIFSGPVASAIGSLYLTGLEDAIIVDIGGTTTDILFARDGALNMSSHGSVVDGFSVSTPSVAGHTTGFGGDSHIRRDIRKQITVGPERVIPICYLASKYPSIMDNLKDMANAVPDPLCQPTDFYTKGWASIPNDLSERELNIIESLNERPRSLAELAKISGCEYPSLLSVDRLDNTGIIMRCGLTPTDVLHAAGQLLIWDNEAAKTALEIYASDMCISTDELYSQIFTAINSKLTHSIVEGAYENSGNSSQSAGKIPQFTKMLLNTESDFINIKMNALTGIIGIGAPTYAYLPEACKAFNTKPVIPNHAEVANAVGAVAGRIALKSKASVSLSSDGDFTVHTQLDRKAFMDMDEAIEYAKSQVKNVLETRVNDDYAGLKFRYDIHEKRSDAESSDGNVFIESAIFGTAVCTSISSKVRKS